MTVNDREKVGNSCMTVTDIKMITFIPKDGICDLWNKFGANTVSVVTAKAMPDKMCGSSGACCALMGCNAIIMCRDFISAVSNFFKLSTSIVYHDSQFICRSRKTNEIDYLRSFKSTSELLMKCSVQLFNSGLPLRLLNLYRVAIYCHKELHTIYPLEVWAKSTTGPNFLDKFKSLFTIGHAAHIQGFMYGASFGIVFGVIVPAWKRRRII